MAYETIKYEVAEQILTITLNRPDKLNAFTATMRREMIDAFDTVDADDEVRAVIVTGAGRGFCAGADLSAGAKTFDRDARAGRALMPTARSIQRRACATAAARSTLAHLRVPEAGDRGGERAGGRRRRHHAACRWTSASPPRTRASASSSPGAASCPRRASSWFLPRLVGISQALEWVLHGPRLPGAGGAGRRAGQQVLPADELLPAARALAREIADNTSPVSVALTRQMMWRMLGADHPMEAHKVDSRGIYTRGRRRM